MLWKELPQTMRFTGIFDAEYQADVGRKSHSLLWSDRADHGMKLSYEVDWGRKGAGIRRRWERRTRD